MKHLEIFKEIEPKINDMCDAALKEGGVKIYPAVNQLALALGQLMAFQKDAEAKAVEGQ